MRQTPQQWADEGLLKYGNGAEAWLRRWKVNWYGDNAMQTLLDEAIEIVKVQIEWTSI